MVTQKLHNKVEAVYYFFINVQYNWDIAVGCNFSFCLIMYRQVLMRQFKTYFIHEMLAKMQIWIKWPSQEFLKISHIVRLSHHFKAFYFIIPENNLWNR